MRSYLKKISILALAAAVNADLTKRDPYWIKMSDVIQQVRPDFYFGVSTASHFFANPKYNDIISTYNLQVAGNECKFYTFNGSQTFNTKPCDDTVAFAKKYGAKFRGHNLFWPAYSPQWFQDAHDGSDPEAVKEFILDYVAKVLDHYKDEEDIIYWDVINESVTDDSTAKNIKLRTGSGNSNEFEGWDTYTEDIFKVAREHTNENVKLFYNDYNAEANNGNFDGKTGAVFEYIRSMREKGVPIDGVGLQMHVSCNWTPNYEQLTKLISQYEEIGVEVHITEIDVKRTQCKSAEAQKEVFMNVFKACFDHENCKVFTVWGSYDEESWVGVENEPVLFDVDMYPKDIYFDMLDYVLEKLPADATYPVPTNTERPTKSTSDTEVAGATYIIKPESYMIDPAWSNWSWGWASVDVNDDGSVVAVLEEDKYGAFSLHTGKKFGAGKIHVELKSDKEGFPVKIIVHSTDDEQIVIKTIDDAYSEELKAYDVEVPAGTYDRISIQDAWGKALTITMNNYYYVPAGTETDEPAPTTAPETPDTPSTPTTPASDKASYVVKPGSSQIESPWANWSWGYESVDFDEEGNVVAVFEEEKYGAFSVHTDKDFNAGTIHVELKSDKAGVPVTIVVHTSADDEFTTLYKIDDSSSDELKAYDVEVPALEGDNYNRITIQDAWGKAITLTINNFYFTPAEPAESTEPTEPVATEGDRYDIVKEGKLDDKWQNWSWGYETIDFDEEGNAVVVFEEAKYGGLSLYTDKVFNAGTIHVELKSDKAGAPVTIAVHTSADDEFNAIYKIDDASSDELKAYDIEVPAIEGDNYNRITIQDAWGKAITLTINNFYFTPAKSTEPTEPTEPVATEGERYDIVKEGELDGKWQNWSWGIDSTEVDEEGNFVNHITAGSWGAVSFKRSDGVEFGAGTLYFKAKVNDTRANLQILFHSSTDDDDYVNVGNYKGISISEMTQYQVEVTAPEGKKYDRITIQDVFNQGITLYLNDVYFVATPKTEEPIDENCWASALGFNCCKTTKTVVFEDQDGSWGVEDDFWCGIVEDKEETCWSVKLGYPCCEVSNAIYSVDDNGSWGYENDHWCGLLKKNEECKFSGLGYTCCPDSEVIFEDDHKWGATSDGQWCGVAF